MSHRSVLAKPASNYYLLLISATALTALGMMMVVSASAVSSFESKGSVFSIALRQIIFLAIAIPSAYVASRLPLERWRSLAKVALFIALFLLVLPQLPGVGHLVNGNRNWISVGPVDIQPSEAAKSLLILWAAHMLAMRERSGRIQTQVLMAIGPGFAIACALILRGRDLGTAVIFVAIACGLLFIAGLGMKHFAGLVAFVVVGVGAMVVVAPNRLHRLQAVIDPFDPSVYKFAGWQPAHSLLGLGSGGLFGVGLGASRQKWGNLAEAHTDFIFSVIGEEFGLLGTLVVLALMIALIFSIFRIAMRAQDSLTKFTTAGIGCWIAAQTVINIGSALSVIPVVGVTLPLVSYGGSSLIVTIIAVGFVYGAARRDAGIMEGVRANSSVSA